MSLATMLAVLLLSSGAGGPLPAAAPQAVESSALADEPRRLLERLAAARGGVVEGIPFPFEIVLYLDGRMATFVRFDQIEVTLEPVSEGD